MISTVLWLLAVAAVTLAGSPMTRFEALRRLDRGSRTVVFFVAGSLFVTSVMFAASAAGLPWAGPWLTTVMAAPILFARRDATTRTSGRMFGAGTAFFVAVTAYGVLSARETCADLVFIWGSKAAHFALARGIDVAFLADPDHFLIHPDYPPLVPLLYGWGTIVAGKMNLWGALLLTPITIGAMAVLMRGFAAASGRRADGAAVAAAAVLSFAFAQALAAGAADPLLVLFETVALCALTFAGQTMGGAALASIGLAAAAMTKVEGVAFVVVAVAAYAIVSRRLVRAAVIALLPLILLAAWITFAWRQGLLDSYARGSASIAWSSAGRTMRQLGAAASYHSLFLPWLAPAALIVTSWWSSRDDRFDLARSAALPVLTAAGSMASILFFYLHDPDASNWIVWSGERVLLTPLSALLVAAVAVAPRDRTIATAAPSE